LGAEKYFYISAQERKSTAARSRQKWLVITVIDLDEWKISEG
jgi:hypothetical protein